MSRLRQTSNKMLSNRALREAAGVLESPGEQDPHAPRPQLGLLVQLGLRGAALAETGHENSFVSVGFYDGSRDIRTSLRTQLPSAVREGLVTFEPWHLVC